MLADKEHQFEEHLSIVTATAGMDLVEQKGNLSPFANKKNNDLSPLNGFPLTITHKFKRGLFNPMYGKRSLFFAP